MQNQEQSNRSARTWLSRLRGLLTLANPRWLEFSTILLLVGITFAAIRQIKLLNYIQWVDESSTIVTAKMIAAGYTLYSEIFCQHGPFIFITGALLESIGDFGVEAHRIPVLLLQWMALLSIYFSPLFEKWELRNTFLLIAMFLVTVFLPEIKGHTYIYQTIGGIFCAIILAQYTLPAIASPEKITPARLAVGNLLIASLPFLAITFLPAAILFGLASLRRRFYKKVIAWLSAGFVLNMLVLIFIGSIVGYFVFHLYFNIRIMPMFGPTITLESISDIFAFLTGHIVGITVLLLLVTVSIKLGRADDSRLFWRTCLVMLAMITFLVRDQNFHALPLYYSLIALPVIFAHKVKTIDYRSMLPLGAISVAIVLKLGLVFGIDGEEIDSLQIRKTTEFGELAKLLTDKDDKIISYPFDPYNYIVADRLPASGNIYFFPWQREYYKHPVLGMVIDACKDIERNRPKIIFLEKWKVWDKYDWDSYGGCIQDIIDRDYVKMNRRPYYIRKDIYSRR